MNLDLQYPSVLKLFQQHLDKGRTESRAFLAWFLEHYYRLDEVAAYDAVCDGPDDKGIDGVYVDENLERIDVFQSKLFQSTAKTIGDAPLRNFVGTIAQLATPTGVDNVMATTGNQELANLLKSSNVSDLVRRGFQVRGVFVCNGTRDQNAVGYLTSQPDVIVYDAPELTSAYVPTGPTPPVATPVTFDVSGYEVIEHKTPKARAVFAPVAATDLIKLDGLSSGKLFVWNVRQSLGRTKVNKEIATSIGQQSEHKNFLLYHNGLTILCESISVNDDQITIAGYNVVNGCQSLTSLYENRGAVSSDLRLLARLVELPPDSDLASRITHHSNNQNSINARDMQSNSAIQRRLQNEFETKYKGLLFYKIKRGEMPTANAVIENEEAAKVLLAFDVEEPWSCHQSYKLFDELHSEVFARPEVNADRIVALFILYGQVEKALEELDNQLMAGYGLTKFFLLYLLKEALRLDPIGEHFNREPDTFLNQNRGKDRIATAVSAVLGDLIVDLNAELADREKADGPFDYKRELKSVTAVKKLAREILPAYEKAVRRNRATSFGEEWERTEDD